jgi:Na+/H+ antiporter NhaD/arsenite permease-like protein
MLIGALEHNGLFEWLGTFIFSVTGGNYLMTVLVILWFAAISSAIVDNIPLVIAMIPLIQNIIPQFAEQMGIVGDAEAIRSTIAEPLFWSLALGACLGGNGTLVGASANVVVTQIARRNNYPISFLGFTVYGAPIMVVTLIFSTVYLYLRYFAFAQ